MMVSSQQPIRASKRKREHVKYYESSDELEHGDNDYFVESEDEGYTSRKKPKVDHAGVKDRLVSKSQIFPFAKLPPELRNRIYQLTLTDPDGIGLISTDKAYRRTVKRAVIGRDESGNGIRRAKGGRTWFWGRTRPEPARYAAPENHILPNMLLLNKATYEEARAILYGGNVFSVEDTMALHGFLAIVGAENRALISEVEICGWGWSAATKAMNHPAFTILSQATNLRRLRISCMVRENGKYYSAKDVARSIYRDAFLWIEAVGRAQGQKDAALKLIDIDDVNHGSSPLDQWRKDFENSLRNYL
ncbi:uncharacterized protein KY384_005101 [Bacidia gigantensis]|uniref:uncharacterized protein n=1 Tax=Bacidia gigantensis TaxID=2732470 RepID=UPI001D039E8B|nr:uncharacterized protein KY384_005101 [Bacidia gigantensis]KAG8529621.1 hypothetical protein KY384_005101 [Bacidia gigantensis]